MNFVLVIDPNTERRLNFVKTVKVHTSPVDGLSTYTVSNGDLSVVWSAGSWTPTSHLNDGEGVAMIWGDAINQLSSDRITPGQLRRLWNKPSTRLPNSFDGFHAAFVYSQNKNIVVGADLLGLFPLYYHTADDVLLVASSPELFKYHTNFKKEFNAKGLVGILLTNGLVDGQTLLNGVKRLNAGHLLTWNSEEGPKELEQYTIPLTTDYFDLSFSDQMDLMDQALERAFARHTQIGNRYSLTLSGGLDSRMICGYLNRIGVKVLAFTEGLPTDIEMKCASKVASTLDFEHHTANIEFDKYINYAEIKVQWEHLANGFSGITRWGFIKHLRELAPYVVTGYLGSPIFGSHADHKTFESNFNFLNNWGFSIDILKKLLKPEIFENFVPDVVASLKEVYRKYSKLDFQKAYCFDLYHRQRFHTGISAWIFSFGAWPVLPLVDSQVLQVAGGMPFSSLLERNLQKEVVCKKFPQLAQCPIDHNSYDTISLKPTILQRLKQYVYGDVGIWVLPKTDKIRKKLINLRGERRYYHRTFDFNSAGWQTIRQNAESGRELVSNLFDENVLKDLLPPANVEIMFKNGISGSASLKNMTGFLLWMKLNQNNIMVY